MNFLPAYYFSFSYFVCISTRVLFCLCVACVFTCVGPYGFGSTHMWRVGLTPRAAFFSLNLEVRNFASVATPSDQGSACWHYRQATAFTRMRKCFTQLCFCLPWDLNEVPHPPVYTDEGWRKPVVWRDVAQPFRALVALSEDRSLVPSTRVPASSHLQLDSKGSDALVRPY